MFSDHRPIFCTVANELPVSNEANYFRDFSHFDSDSFLRDVEAIDFSGLANNDVNQRTGISNLVDILQEISDKHAPKRRLNGKKKIRLNKPWISNAIATSIKRKQRLFNSRFLSRDPEKIKIYKVFNNKLNKNISWHNLALIVRPQKELGSLSVCS